MAAVLKTCWLMLLVIMPGGLLVLAALTLAKVVARQWNQTSDHRPAQMVRAVANMSLKDVWVETRRAL
ncbi:MAG: hypothetical protein K1X64_20080 [Myxococcaceae bacterium]|nr:hypothetical protein [Myxococcaceae bacterium]